MTQQYRIPQVGGEADTQGALQGPEQGLVPASKTAYGQGQPGIDRAATSYSNVPSFENLLRSMQDAGIQGGPRTSPLMPTQPAEAPAAGQPTGVPGSPESSIPVLSGLGGGLDFLSKLGLAPAYLGKYRDPNTGIVYTSTAGDRSGLGPAEDMFPELAGLEAVLQPFGLTARMGDIWKKYGISPLEQARQVFDFKNAGDAASEAMTPQARGIARATETAIPLVGGAAVDLARGKALTNTMMALMNGETVLQSTASTPGVVDASVRKLREAYILGAAGEASALRNIVGEAVLNPSNVLLGAVPIAKLGTLGVAGLKRLPVVDTAVRGSITKFGDLVADSWLMQRTDFSKAAMSAENVHDGITGYLGLKGIHDADGPEILRAIREFRDTPLDDVTMEQLVEQSPRDYKAAQQTLQAFSTPRAPKGRVPTDPVKLAAWEAKRNETTPIGQTLTWAERELAAGNQLGVGNILEQLDVSIRKAELAALNKGKDPAGFFERLVTSYERGISEFNSVWKPLTLALRPAWYANNEASGMAIMVQRYGAFWGQYGHHANVLRENGLLPERLGKQGPFSPVARDVVGPSPAYLFSGFGTGLDQPNLPKWLANMPVLGKALESGLGFAARQERHLHEVGFVEPAFQYLVDGSRQVLDRLSTPVNTLPARWDALSAIARARTWQSVDATLGPIPGSLNSWDTLPDVVKESLKAADTTTPIGLPVLGGSLTSQGRAILSDSVGAAQVERRLRAWQSGSHDPKDWIPYGILSQRVAARLDTVLDRAAKTQGGIAQVKTVEDAFAGAIEATLANGVEMRQVAARLDLSGNTITQDIMRATGRPMSAAGQQAIDHGNTLVAQWQQHGRDFQRFFHDSLTSAKRPSKKYKDNMFGILAILDNAKGKVTDQYIKAHGELVAQTWQTQRSWGRLLPVERAARGDALWDSGYFPAWMQQQSAQARRLEGLDNLAAEAVQKKWTSQQFQAAVNKLPAWIDDQVGVSLAPEVLDAWNKSKNLVRGNISDDDFAKVAQQAGFTSNAMPGQPIDLVQVISDDVAKDVKQLELARDAFREQAQLWRSRAGQPATQKMMEEYFGMDPEVILNTYRQSTMVARDRGVFAAKELQFDYKDRRNIDRVLAMAFPFSFWQSRYMLFQAKQAAKNPQQAYQITRTLKAWYDANEDRPWYDRFSAQSLTLDAGTPKEMEVRFSPMNMLFPVGSSAAEVIRAADNDEAGVLTQGFELVSNLLGGAFYPWSPVLAAQVGIDLEGGPPKSLADVAKTIVPPITWARQAGATVASALGGSAISLAMLTEQEQDGIIRAMAQDVNAGLLDKTLAARAAASVKSGKPDPVAVRYTEKVAPERLIGTAVRTGVSLKGAQLPEQVTNMAWEALNNAKTEADRQAVYQAFPGLSVSLAGKRGDELELAMIHANAPVVPELRSIYYRQNSDRIGYLTGEVDKAKGNDPADWKLRSATPESFESFRMAGGQKVITSLANYWLEGKPLPPETRNVLHGLYDQHGMGSISYDQWLRQVLPDAYRQWTFQNAERLKQGR